MAALWLGASACKVDLAGTGPDDTDMDPALGGLRQDGGDLLPPPVMEAGSPPAADAALADDAAQPAHDAGDELDAAPAVPDAAPARDDAGPAHDAGPDDGGSPDAVTSCMLDGRYALRVTFDVSWVGTRFASFVPIVSPGRGDLSFILLGDIHGAAGSTGGGSAQFRACQASVPDFVSTLPNEHYAARFADAVWDSPSMPLFDTLFSGCTGEGCTLSTPVIHAQIGSALPDPMGPWPEGVAEGTWIDHDGDGRPGIATNMLGPRAGLGYAYPPIDVLSTRRLSDFDLALRVVVGFDLQRSGCDDLIGTVRDGAVDTRALDCTPTAGAKKCSETELGFFNNALPVWTVSTGSVEGVRISSSATCLDARLAFE